MFGKLKVWKVMFINLYIVLNLRQTKDSEIEICTDLTNEHLFITRSD